MALVKLDDMTTLRPAAEARATAETAKDEHNLQAVAYAINNASNTGEYRVVFSEFLRPATLDRLEEEGYTVLPGGVADPNSPTVITWQPERG